VFTVGVVIGSGDMPTVQTQRCGNRTANEAHSEHVCASRHGSSAYGEQLFSAR
jgi:hypothetical protein